MKKLLLFIATICAAGLFAACSKPTPEANSERAIVERVTVKANINEVWRAWTTTEGITSFFAPAANIDLRPGGAYEVFMLPNAKVGERGADGMVLLAVQDKKMISFTWNAPPSLPEARKQRTVVIVRFNPRGEQLTEVTLTHLGFGTVDANNKADEWGKAYDYFARAWPNVLKNLQKRFESGPVNWTAWLESLQKPVAPNKK